MDNLILSLNVTLPVFLLVFLGIFLKRRGMIDQCFISNSNAIVFNISLPSLIFIKIAAIDFKTVFSLAEIAIACGFSLLFFMIAWIYAHTAIEDNRSKGAFIQGSFRSNIAIIGIALINNLFGPTGVARGAIMLAILMPIFALLSVVALTVPVHAKDTHRNKKILTGIATNPLVIAAIAALPVSYFHIELPYVIKQTMNILSDITLPLALMSIGGSLNFKAMKKKFMPAMVAAIIKLIAMPFTATAFAVYIGLRGEYIGVLFIMLGAPSAVSSYIMAQAMNSDDELAGHIVLITTLGAIITIPGGIFLLKSYGLI